MILLDGIRYEEWKLPDEETLESMVTEHFRDIFGEDSIFFDKKRKIKSIAGIGSIPDGLAITTLKASPKWHIVEVELSSHDPYQHIIPQVDRFLNAVDNYATRNKIVGVIYDIINSDNFLKEKVRQAVDSGMDIHKFLSDLISDPPTVTIIIEKHTGSLKEALKKYPQTKVMEFQTFRRVGAEKSHMHLFEPFYRDLTISLHSTGYTEEDHKGTVMRSMTVGRQAADTRRRSFETSSVSNNATKRITIQNLLDARILKIGQVLWGLNKGIRYDCRIIAGGKILLTNSSTPFDSPSGAASGAKGTSEDGWRWWRTRREDGTECALDDMRKEFVMRQR